MIGHNPETGDVHIILEKNVEIMHADNLLVFMNKDQAAHGDGKVFLRIENEEDLDKLALGIIESRKFLRKRELKRKKERYVSFEGQTRFQLQKFPAQ